MTCPPRWIGIHLNVSPVHRNVTPIKQSAPYLCKEGYIVNEKHNSGKSYAEMDNTKTSVNRSRPMEVSSMGVKPRPVDLN